MKKQPKQEVEDTEGFETDLPEFGPDDNIPDAGETVNSQLNVDTFMTADKNGRSPIKQLIGVPLVFLEMQSRNSSYQNGEFYSISARKVGETETIGFNTGSKPVLEALHKLEERVGFPFKGVIQENKARSGFTYFTIAGTTA